MLDWITRNEPPPWLQVATPHCYYNSTMEGVRLAWTMFHASECCILTQRDCSTWTLWDGYRFELFLLRHAQLWLLSLEAEYELCIMTMSLRAHLSNVRTLISCKKNWNQGGIIWLLDSTGKPMLPLILAKMWTSTPVYSMPVLGLGLRFDQRGFEPWMNGTLIKSECTSNAVSQHFGKEVWAQEEW